MKHAEVRRMLEGFTERQHERSVKRQEAAQAKLRYLAKRRRKRKAVAK